MPKNSLTNFKVTRGIKWRIEILILTTVCHGSHYTTYDIRNLYAAHLSYLCPYLISDKVDDGIVKLIGYLSDENWRCYDEIIFQKTFSDVIEVVASLSLQVHLDVAHLSPVMTNVNNNNHNNDYFQLQEQQQRQLKTKSSTMKVKTPLTHTHTTPTTNYMRAASNWFDSKTYEAMHSFAMKERRDAPKTLAVIPEWTTFTIFTTGRRFFTPFTTTVTVHSKATTSTTISNDISTETVSISTMTATKSREQYFISEESSAMTNGVFIMASDEMQSKEGQKTLHNSIKSHNNIRFIKPTGSYICATKTTTKKRDEISNLNNSTTQTSIISNTSNGDDATTIPSLSQITHDVGQRNLIEKPTQRLTRHQDDKAITIPLQSIPLYSITIERQQQHRQNTENGNNNKDNDRQDVATLTTASASASASAPSSASTSATTSTSTSTSASTSASASASRTITITKASRSTQIERKETAIQPVNQLRRPMMVTTTTTTSSLLQRYARQAADAEQNDKCRMFVDGDPAKNEFYSPEFPNNYTKNINCTRVIVEIFSTGRIRNSVSPMLPVALVSSSLLHKNQDRRRISFTINYVEFDKVSQKKKFSGTDTLIDLLANWYKVFMLAEMILL
uniref:CUB domain-containing protein n=1 Tax=Glossina palpalis gambiensis TaxID=67801 RepID=A0A1B0BNW1_9MUSC